MKLFKLSLLLNLLSIMVSGQTSDTVSVKIDTSKFITTNAFLTPHKNYETFNNSFITGNSDVTVRSQDKPRILIDGIPINPNLLNYNEFLGHMHLLSYDIQSVDVNTLQNDSRIVSGKYNNAISFNTSDIQLGKSAYQFEANNYTSLAYQDFDSLGYSTIFNLKVQKSYDKFGYRVSLNNGYQNDYIPENGLQRYGGNLKLKYQPFKQLLLTGFLDYTQFKDFKRSGEDFLKRENMDPGLEFIERMKRIGKYEIIIPSGNIHKSNRLFTYINADLALTESLLLYGKYSYNSIADTSKRILDYTRTDRSGNPYQETYLENIFYKYTSSYFDIGLSFKKLIEENTAINLTLGISRNSLNYSYESYTATFLSKWYSQREPEETEKALYSALKLQNKHLSLNYLFSTTYYELDNIYFSNISSKDNENKTFTNHLVSLNYDFINNDDKKINHLGFGATYGKLANYSIILSYEPEWIVALNNNNIELDLFSSFLKKRIDFSFTYYYKKHKEDLGKLTRNGFEINGDFHLIRNKSLDWILKTSFSKNSTELEHNEKLVIPDTTINNHIISIINSFRYKNFQLSIAFERKNGYDVNLYGNSIIVAKPFSYQKHTQVTGVNNEGVPISKEVYSNVPGNHGYITDTDYFILKQIGLQYQINNHARNKTFAIGLQYNKMRRLYLYVNDVANYQGTFQRPSFYNAISLSLTMRF